MSAAAEINSHVPWRRVALGAAAVVASCLGVTGEAEGYGGLTLPGATRLGVHNGFDERAVADLDPEMVRVIVNDRAIAAGIEAIEGGEASSFLERLKGYDDAGIEVVVTVRWPTDPGASGRVDTDRVPRGADRVEALSLLRRFVTGVGPYVGWIQLGNEVIAGPGRYELADRGDSIGWLTAEAREIAAVRASDPELRHLGIVSPAIAFPALDGREPPEPNPGVLAYFEELVRLAEAETDALDAHLHVSSVDDARTIVEFVRGYTAMPLTTLEWSQAKVGKDWLREPAPPGFGPGTNRDYIARAYADRVPAGDWDRFIAGSPHDPGRFMPRMYRLLMRERFVDAAYAPGHQYGNPLYDADALFANQVVAGPLPHNGRFFDAFTSLAAPRCYGRRATIVAKPGSRVEGTGRADVIVGTRGGDVVRSRGGRDLVCARGGGDRIRGGQGADRLDGGAGRDRIRGGQGTDRLDGGPGRDQLDGGPGRDRVRGEPGRGRADGRPGRSAAPTRTGRAAT